MPRTLRLIVRTPREVVWDQQVASVRIPTETGQVGVHPRTEPFIAPVESGVVLVRTDSGDTLIGVMGGLLSVTRGMTTLLTPMAVIGTDAAALRTSLDAALASPDVELAARRTLARLEGRIVSELQSAPTVFRKAAWR